MKYQKLFDFKKKLSKKNDEDNNKTITINFL